MRVLIVLGLTLLAGLPLAAQAQVKAHPGLEPAALAAGFDGSAWPEWKPNPSFITWESFFSVASAKGPGRVQPKP
jgi:hypothetical protein